MNINTGECKYLEDLTDEEKADNFWQRVPNGKANKEAFEAIKRGENVDLEGNSKLAKFARRRREEPKGIISKKRFRDLKRELKNV